MKYFAWIIFSFLVSETQAQKRVVIVGEQVNVRAEANQKSKKIGSLSTGQTANFLQKSKKKEAIAKEADATCDAYFWYNIQVPNQDKASGWVYGEYVYILDSLVPVKNTNTDKFIFNKQKYQLFCAKYTGKGAFDEEGLTSCDAQDYLFFVPADNPQKAYPIHLAFSKNAHSWEKIYLDEGFNPRGLLLISEGTHVFKQIKYEPETARFVLTCEFYAQDTPSKQAQISIVYNASKGQFEAYLEKLTILKN